MQLREASGNPQSRAEAAGTDNEGSYWLPTWLGSLASEPITLD